MQISNLISSGYSMFWGLIPGSAEVIVTLGNRSNDEIIQKIGKSVQMERDSFYLGIGVSIIGIIGMGATQGWTKIAPLSIAIIGLCLSVDSAKRISNLTKPLLFN